MGDEQNGGPLVIEGAQLAHHFGSGLGVQVARWLVGHDDGRLGRHGPGDGHPLLLAAGQLHRPVMHPLSQPHFLQGAEGQLPPLPRLHPPVDQGQFHILQGGEGGNQVEALEDKADVFVPDGRKPPGRDEGYILPIQPIFPIGGGVQTA